MEGAAVGPIGAGDLIVVLPGILGSTLYRGGKQVWGVNTIVRGVASFRRDVTRDLVLPPGAFENPAAGMPDDVIVGRPIRTHAIIPGFISVQGYDRLVANLASRFPDDSGCVVEFPYDWRQSNEYTARLLAIFVDDRLTARRKFQPDAQVTFIGHSMGGLVATFFAEHLDSQKVTRRIVTVGTPFQGSVNALTVLVNGFTTVGPRRLELAEFVRSCPSIAELLPTFPCVQTDTGATVPIQDLPEEFLPRQFVNRAIGFRRRPDDAATSMPGVGPTTHALLSFDQPTAIAARLDESDRRHLAPVVVTDFENGGDGTVPRLSASPAYWPDDSRAVFLSGRHSQLQQMPEALVQLNGILSARQRVVQGPDLSVAVSADPMVEVGQDWEVTAVSSTGVSDLALRLTVSDPWPVVLDGAAAPSAEPGDLPRDRGPSSPVGDPYEAQIIEEVPLRPRSPGTYSARISFRRPGSFDWSVSSVPGAGTSVPTVSDVIVCAAD